MRNPFSFLRTAEPKARQSSPKGDDRKSAAPAARLPRGLRAHFRAADAAPSIPDWWKADNLPADIDASPDIRRRLRMRSRFEVQNNSYARGIVQTLAKDSIGSGPRLRFGLDDDALNTRVERDFTAWSEMIRLATKLKTIRIARAQDGEAFVILANNPALRDTEMAFEKRPSAYSSHNLSTLLCCSARGVITALVWIKGRLLNSCKFVKLGG